MAACAAAPVSSQPTPRLKPAVANTPVTTVAQPAITTPQPAAKMDEAAQFNAWKQDFISRALAKGYDIELIRTTIGTAKINPKAIKKNKNQPEFTRTIWSYLDSVTSDVRVWGGHEKLAAHGALFTDLESRYGVDRFILTSIWGLESAYGTIMGDDNMIDSLATLAVLGGRKTFGEQQLFGILDILSRGEVRKDQLFGSWAGAMGMTQFIPTTFRDYAVDYDNDGNKDLWHYAGDALASTASYLNRFGWRGSEPVYTEIILPQGFDFGLSNGIKGNGIKRTVSAWSGLGLRSVNGKNWSNEALFLEAKLFMPAGAKGPAFLTYKNFDVIKKYNNSDLYAMGIASLGQTLAGKQAIKQAWPRADKALSLTDRKDLQRALNRQGYDTGGVDGIIGRTSRRAIRAWQKANGLAADGYVNQALLKRIIAS